MNLYEFENYEEYEIAEQKEGNIISVYADVSEYIDYPDENVDMLKCDAGV